MQCRVFLLLGLQKKDWFSKKGYKKEAGTDGSALWGVKQVLFLWRVLFTEKPCFSCRVRTRGPEKVPKGKGKTRKVGPSDSVYDYLSKGTLYISLKKQTPGCWTTE